MRTEAEMGLRIAEMCIRDREKAMCSIFGVLDIKTDAGELRKKALELSRLMRHRGPDWSGVYALSLIHI